MEKTKVLFLIDKPVDEFTAKNEKIESGGVFAFFPETYNYTGEAIRESYSHIGQHSPCSIDYAKECKEATPEQYKDLKGELESIGYNLQILNLQQ